MDTGDDSSDLSSLESLSPAPSEDELELEMDIDAGTEEPSSDGDGATTTKIKKKKKSLGILKFFPKASELPAREPSPPPRKRSPSPPHEYVLADNPDIAFIVMFRSRFNDAFPKSLPHFGPQELERDVVTTVPGDRVEHFLCALLGLLLNRKQDVKPGHYGRALEDAISSHKSQWAKSWGEKNPLSGGTTFNSMDPTERLTLLRTLILWALASSEIVKGLIQVSYKQNRHEDDLNQPRAVQAWGSDGDKRRYFLIEGQDDTNFRVYRESNPQATNRTWWSVAGSIEELKELSQKLETKDGGPKAKKFSQKIMAVVPRFEAGEEKRKRRDYRQAQKERFKRPEPGFSMYEGRTRGKRVKYTYSDDEDMTFSDSTNRRSARNTGTTTPAETGPLTTQSGRHVRAPTRLNVTTGDSAPGSVQGDTDMEQESEARPRRSAASNGRESQSQHEGSSESDEESEAEFGDDEEDADAHVPEDSEEEDEFDDDEAMVADDLEDGHPRSLVVKLSVTPPKLRTALAPLDQATNIQPPQITTSGGKEYTGTRVEEMPDAPEAVTDPSSVPSKLEARPGEQNGTREKQSTPEPTAVLTEKTGIPSGTPTTALAFRGSPDKTHATPAEVSIQD